MLDTSRILIDGDLILSFSVCGLQLFHLLLKDQTN